MSTRQRSRPSRSWVAVLLATVLVQACAAPPAPPVATSAAAGQASNPTTQSAPAAAAAQPAAATVAPAAGTPKMGGILRMAEDTDPGGLDMQKVTDVQAQQMLMPIYSQLIREVPNSWDQLEGDLATKWEPSADGKTWTFTLRQDAKWQDGPPVTADDVVYSLNRMISPPPGFKGGNAGCLKETAVSASANSTYEVAVQLKAPALSFLQCLGMAYIRIMPKHIIEPIDTNEGSRDLKQSELIGSGAFKFKSYQSGSAWVLERNPDYYMNGQPYLDGITYYIIPDLNTRLAGFRAGQLDMMRPTEPLSPSQEKQLQSDMNNQVVIKEANNARLIGLFFNTQTGPFQDIRLRRAANLAVNRQSMIDLLLEGKGSITTPLCTCWPFIYDEAYYLTQPGYRADKTADLAQARELVNEASGGAGAEVVLTVANVPPYPDFAQVVQQQLNEVGFHVTLNPMENAVAQQRYGDGQFQAAVHPGAVPFLDPDSMITRYFLPSGDRNWARWNNQEFDDLFAKESVNTNADERAQQLRRMADILQDEVPVVGLPDSLLISPMSPKVQGLDKMPTTVNADLRFDWVWLS